jgi:hypothetical protein
MKKKDIKKELDFAILDVMDAHVIKVEALREWFAYTNKEDANPEIAKIMEDEYKFAAGIVSKKQEKITELINLL